MLFADKVNLDLFLEIQMNTLYEVSFTHLLQKQLKGRVIVKGQPKPTPPFLLASPIMHENFEDLCRNLRQVSGWSMGNLTVGSLLKAIFGG